MYGLPDNLDLTPFAGVRLDSITFAEYTVHLAFEKDLAITIEAFYVYNSSPCANVDQGRPIEHSRLLELVGLSLRCATRDGRDTLSLHFDDNKVLTIFDKSVQYESFIIAIGNQRIIV